MPLRATSEETLRRLWLGNAFAGAPLRTDDGVHVSVRSPGVANADGGPDFLDARIRIGGVLCRGDVELHTRAASWHAHGHDTDPHYNRVILHAVLNGGQTRTVPRTASGRIIPQVVLPHLVDRHILRAHAPGRTALCRRAGRRLSGAALAVVLRRQGMRKLRERAQALRRRLFQIIEEGHGCAWDQLLYECVLEGMGYSKNRAPFIALARSVPLQALAPIAGSSPGGAEALLFGQAGLLPPARSLPDKESRGYVRCQRRRWRRLRAAVTAPRLREEDWMFFRLRPANFPSARLAGFCRLLPLFAAGDAFGRILSVLRHPPARARRELESLLAIHAEGFWSRHLHFGGRGGSVALGRERIHDLAVNAFIPLALLRAGLTRDRRLGRSALALMGALPRSAQSAPLREMRMRLGGTPPGSRLAIEGALRLRARYCNRSGCRRCPAIRTSRPRSPGRMSTSRRP